MFHADGVEVVACLEVGRVRRIGDDADCAGLRVRAVERALWPAQNFDTGNVVYVDVQVAADGRHRLFVQVDADARLRARRVAVAAIGDSADVDLRFTRPQ